VVSLRENGKGRGGKRARLGPSENDEAVGAPEEHAHGPMRFGPID